MLEHIIAGQLKSHLEGFLHNHQYGFKEGLSCTTQLVTVMHDIMSSADKGHTIHAAV